MLSFNFSLSPSLVKMSINYHCANFFSRRCVMCKSSENGKKKIGILAEKKTMQDSSSRDGKRKLLTC